MDIKNYKKHLEYDKKLLKIADNLINKYSKFYKKINKEQIQALSYYKNDGFIPINKILYNGKLDKNYNINFNFIKNTSDGREIIAKRIFDYVKTDITKILSYIPIIDSIFIKTPASDKSLTVFRGIRENKKDKFISKYKVGDKVKFNSYISTSLAPNISTNFLDYGKSTCCFMIITVPKNVKMIYIPWIKDKNNKIKLPDSFFGSDEFELLLPRGTEFIVKKIESMKASDLMLHKYQKYKHIFKEISSNKRVTIYYLNYIGNNPEPITINADQLLDSIDKICIKKIRSLKKFT